MLPTREHLVQAFGVFAETRKLDEQRSAAGLPGPAVARPAAIDAALVMAHAMVAEGHGEVAAILYALGRHPRCFPGGLLAFTAIVAKQVAHSNGTYLQASADEFKRIILECVHGTASVADVDAWVGPRCLSN